MTKTFIFKVLFFFKSVFHVGNHEFHLAFQAAFEDE